MGGESGQGLVPGPGLLSTSPLARRDWREAVARFAGARLEGPRTREAVRQAGQGSKDVIGEQEHCSRETAGGARGCRAAQKIRNTVTPHRGAGMSVRNSLKKGGNPGRKQIDRTWRDKFAVLPPSRGKAG